MKEINGIVSENTENINGLVVVTRVTNSGTRFYIKEADGVLAQLGKKQYFKLLEEQSVEQLATAKTIREVNSTRNISYEEYAKEDRSKVDWFHWNQDNNLARDKAKAVLDLMDMVEEIPDYIDEENDVVNVGGWLYRKGDTLGFISHHLKAKSNLDITVYSRDEVMPYWEQLKSDYIVSKFKYIPNLLNDIGTSVVSEYFVTPQLDDEQMLEIALGNKSEADFSSMIYVYRHNILDVDCLVHVLIGCGEENRVYFVEELISKEDTENQGEEDEL